MQIVRTEVSQATTPAGESVLRVLFCGEGGDCVTVDMANTEAGNGEAATIGRAPCWFQTATFRVAANDYDARSNGNFDEVDVTAANDENGAAFIF